MAYLFPRLPRGQFEFEYIGNNLIQDPGEGGETLVIARLGTRFKVSTTVRLRGDQGMGLVALVNGKRTEKVRLLINQMMAIATAGSAVQANGANQGSILKFKGLPANYPLRGGQYFTVVKNGKRYLHQIVEPTTATPAGLATAVITPMLRVALTGNEVIEVDAPSIEGYLDGPTSSYGTDFDKTVTVTVTVKEAE